MNKNSGDVEMVNIEGIKELLSKKENAEIRIGFAEANNFGLLLDDISIVKMFREGIAIDIIIKKVGEYDNLPWRLEKYLEDKDEKVWGIDELFVKTKIVNLTTGKPLDPLEIATYLLNVLPNDFKVSGRQITVDNPDEDGFVKIRVIDAKDDKFLTLQEIRELFSKIISPDKYQFYVEEL